MQKDLIRTDEERAARLQLVKANRLQRQEKLLTVSSSHPSPKSTQHRPSQDVSFAFLSSRKTSFDSFS